ncbi:MAG: pitrilysin family protein [bacterium]|nr:pitrilysin family protein [bacterium]
MKKSMFSKTALKNGVRLITIPMQVTRAVTCLVMVGAGSKYETKKTNGVAHFLEHMMFKGTKRRPSALQIASLLDGIGSDYNAFTGKEYTGYYVKAADEHLELALDVLSDSYQHSLFVAEEIEKERGVITEEINMYLDTPARHIGDLWEKLLYGDTPAGWTIAGEKENIAAMQRDDFIDYLHAHYTAPNTTIVVAGKFNERTIKKTVERYFGSLKRSKAGSKKPVREAQTSPQFLLHAKQTDQTQLMVGVRAYHLFSPKRYALSLLGTILGGGMSSRLFMEVRERRGLAYSVHTSPEFHTDSGYMVTQAGVRKEATAEALSIILAEYKKIADKGVSGEELDKAKHYTEGKILLGLETSDALAFYAGEQEALAGRIRTPDEVITTIKKVTAKQIQDVARDIFQQKRLNAVLLGPFDPKDEARFRKLVTFR